MKLISHQIWHFKEMFLMQKLLILVGCFLFIYTVFSLIINDIIWLGNRGNWITAATALLIVLSQFRTHLYNLKSEKAIYSNSHI